MTAYLKGIDVAYPYQNATYKTDGFSFVFVKATQGKGYVNPEQSAMLDRGTHAGLVPGVYHFMEPADSVLSQVAWFRTHAIVKSGYMIAVDWEKINGVWPSNADKDELIKALKTVYPGHKVGLYTNLDGWLNHDHTNYCGDFLWIADPGVTPGQPHVKHKWDFHQFGIVSNVDQDVSRFTDLAALKTWAGYGSAPVPVETPPKAVDTSFKSEPGYPIWGYRNPVDGEDAWAKLNRIEALVIAMAKKMGI